MAARRIQTSAGELAVDETGGVVHARGVPYAMAERFDAPTPVARSSTVVDTADRGPACPQLRSRLEFVTGPVVDGLRISEHCQVLSVTAPADAVGLPVMVWFHGGAYVSGGGEAPKYDPDALVVEGRVVVVTVTYRLGIFGYLNLEDPDTQNLGLRDQILALQWVQNNIAAFGGDPARVCVFGQSAGADSVFSLLLSTDASGLFSRAIMQSAPLGVLGNRAPITAEMRDAAISTLNGTSPTDASVEQLLDAQVSAVSAAQRFGTAGMMAFAPVMGCAPLPSESEARQRLADATAHVELFIGYTRRDALPFVAMDPRGNRLRRSGPAGRAITSVVARRMTRRVFGQPALALVDEWRAAGGRAASFIVDWSPPNSPLGACHCIELPLLFGTPGVWSDAPMLGNGAVDEELARGTRALWSRFAADGCDALRSTSLAIGGPHSSV